MESKIQAMIGKWEQRLHDCVQAKNKATSDGDAIEASYHFGVMLEIDAVLFALKGLLS